MASGTSTLDATAPPTEPAAPAPATPASPPSKLLGKFENVDALATAYTELEKKLGERGGKPAETTPEPAKPAPRGPLDFGTAAPAVEDEDIDVPTLITKSGLKLDDVVKQWSDKGDLTPEQFAAIRKASPGTSNAVIRHIADGLQAKAKLITYEQQAIRGKLAGMVGGDDKFQMMMDTASTYIPTEQMAGLQALLNNPATAEAAWAVIMQHHAKKGGYEGSRPLVTGQQGGSSGISSKEAYENLRRKALDGDPAAIEKFKNLSHTENMRWK